MSKSDSNKASDRRPSWGEQAVISSYGDLARDPKLTDVQIEALVRALNQHGHHADRLVFRLKSWLTDPEACDDPKELEPEPAAEGVFTGCVRRASEKAVCVFQPGTEADEQWLPRSQMITYELATGTDSITSPQAGLDAFAGAGGGE